MIIHEQLLCGLPVVARDGDAAGRVHTLLFDDTTWIIRHVELRTRHWLSGRAVAIPPTAIVIPAWPPDRLLVEMDRNEIDDGPDPAAARPVSEQEEIRLHLRQGASLGILYDGFNATLMVPTASMERETRGSKGVACAQGDRHLRSTRAVRGYRLQFRTGDPIGHAEDFVIDTSRWKISHLVVRFHSWPHPRRLVVPTGAVVDINWEDRLIHTRLSASGQKPCSQGRSGAGSGRS